MPVDRILVGNAQAFWGDDPDAPARLVRQQPDLDFLTLDYLAEVSLSIMSIQREKGPTSGYARDFLEVLHSLTQSWRDGSRLKVISNAGELNPVACGRACVAALAELARKAEDYERLRERLTEDVVKKFFDPLGLRKVIRYEVRNLDALNFLLEGILGEGGSRSLRIDAQGKTLGQAILELTL